MGHECRIGLICATSALPPIADKRADIDFRRCGPATNVFGYAWSASMNKKWTKHVLVWPRQATSEHWNSYLKLKYLFEGMGWRVSKESALFQSGQLIGSPFRVCRLDH